MVTHQCVNESDNLYSEVLNENNELIGIATTAPTETSEKPRRKSKAKRGQKTILQKLRLQAEK